MPTKNPRFSVVADEETLARLDDFRFGRRYSSRSKAALELIKLGLDQIEEEDSSKAESRDEF